MLVVADMALRAIVGVAISEDLASSCSASMQEALTVIVEGVAGIATHVVSGVDAEVGAATTEAMAATTSGLMEAGGIQSARIPSVVSGCHDDATPLPW